MKTSFVRYVRVIAGGTCEAAGGAVLGADDVIEFPLLAAAGTAGTRVLSFGGGVRFSAHHGALDVNLTGLRLELGPHGGAVSIAVGKQHLTIASIGPAAPTRRDGSLYWQSLLPRLTETGVPVFGTVYPAGTGLAPLDVRVPIDS